tara:strand:- start:2686 stop:3012 length:327 start_codon:yes stop_codon:yes gene_type:complete
MVKKERIETKFINKVRNKYLKTLRKFNYKLEKKELTLEQTINYMNQIYFINHTLDKLEYDIKNLNTCIINNTTLSQKKKIKKDNEELKMDRSINKFKPYILADYFFNK